MRVQEIFQEQQECSHYTGTAEAANFPMLTGLIECSSCAEILDWTDEGLPLSSGEAKVICKYLKQTTSSYGILIFPGTPLSLPKSMEIIKTLASTGPTLLNSFVRCHDDFWQNSGHK